jgi:probable phosphoglycerate mutase
MVVDHDLTEWDYGEYEGLRTAEILQRNPDWDLFRDGVPNGESPAAISARADRVVARLRAAVGTVLIFSSGHFLRVLAVRWLGLEVTAARYLLLGTASISILSYEHSLREPAIALWNQTPAPQPTTAR